ncbi:MAG: ribosome maturation factor RimP [Bacillales bacterium]|nr:ribosome maturation factor RimP [Bacillales bacterium]MDY6003356.1 ribosome maturation factor RimP [Bacilli bacterium]
MNETQIKQLIEPTINKLGYSLESVSLIREKGDLFLQIVVDRFDPISLDDIVAISNEISPILDENDPIKDNYFLDVTSLGAEKPIKLEHLDKYINKYVNLHVINPIKGENYLEGNIDSVNDDILILSYKIKTRLVRVEIPRKDIDKARLAIKF